jgi:hypothetical protein
MASKAAVQIGLAAPELRRRCACCIMVPILTDRPNTRSWRDSRHGMPRVSTRAESRRPKSAKAGNRGRWFCGRRGVYRDPPTFGFTSTHLMAPEPGSTVYTPQPRGEANIAKTTLTAAAIATTTTRARMERVTARAAIWQPPRWPPPGGRGG